MCCFTFITEFVFLIGPVTNAMIVNTPPAVSGSGLPRLHVPISNFKRSLHRPLPASRHGSFQDNAGDNGIPCILKNVHEVSRRL